MPRGAPIDGAALALLRHMRCHFQLARPLHETLLVVILVCTYRAARLGRALQHLQRRLYLGTSIELGAFHIHDQTVAVLHHRVGHVRQTTGIAIALARQPGLGIAGRLVGRVAALLALEVGIGVARAILRWVAAILLDKGLVRGPGVDQRAIDAEMLVAGVLGPCGQRLDALEEQPRYILVEQAVTVLAEGRVIPHALVHRQADEPAKQQVEINLLDQLPLGANGVNHLQQRGAQQPLRRNRGPSQGGVQPVEVPIHRSQNGIDQASQGTQRVIVRDALLQRRITEQLVLFEVESTHRLGLASAEEDGRHFARATRALAFFNGLLGEKSIPCIVVSANEADRFLISLVENLARRKHSNKDLLSSIQVLSERGYSPREIAEKTSLDVAYINGILMLLRQGEERLIAAVEKGWLPIKVATEIARANDSEVQQAMVEAYETGVLKGDQLIRIRRLIDRRKAMGKRYGQQHHSERMTTPQKLLNAYQAEVRRQRVMIKKADINEQRLLIMVTALRQLLADDYFCTLLRTEDIQDMPKPLADRIHGEVS